MPDIYFRGHRKVVYNLVGHVESIEGGIKLHHFVGFVLKVLQLIIAFVILAQSSQKDHDVDLGLFPKFFVEFLLFTVLTVQDDDDGFRFLGLDEGLNVNDVFWQLTDRY